MARRMQAVIDAGVANIKYVMIHDRICQLTKLRLMSGRFFRL